MIHDEQIQNASIEMLISPLIAAMASCPLSELRVEMKTDLIRSKSILRERGPGA